MAVQQGQDMDTTSMLKQKIDDLQAEGEAAAEKPLYKTLADVDAAISKQDD